MNGPPECSGHSHDDVAHEDSLGLSLRPFVDMIGVQCWNEAEPGSGQKILKLHEDRLSSTPSLHTNNDDDEEDVDKLLLHVPFTEAVQIQSISIHTASGNNNNNNNNNDNAVPPKTLKLIVNRNDVDLDMCVQDELTEDAFAAKIDLLPPQHFENGTIDYPARPAGRFQQVTSLSLYFADNYSGDDSRMHVQRRLPTKITYVGFKGKGTHMKRQAVQTVYETRGNLADHKVPEEGMGGSHFV